MWTLGLTLYFSTIPGNSIIAALAWRRGLWRERPAFAVYLTFCAARTVALSPYMLTGRWQEYSALYWHTELLAIALLWWACGECAHLSRFAMMAGAVAAAALAAQRLWTQHLLALGDRSQAIQAAYGTLALDRWLTLAAAALALYCFARLDGGRIAAGLALASTVHGMVLQSVGTMQWTRFLAVAAWLAAQYLWLASASEHRRRLAGERRPAQNLQHDRHRAHKLARLLGVA